LDIFEEYKLRQSWRNWEEYFAAIPIKADDHVLDLGCSLGGVSNLLAKRVTHVTGIDVNYDFINYCNANKQSNQHFICDDFSAIQYLELAPITGIWSSFSLSYLKNPAEFLESLYNALPPGGWIALVDVACFISGNMLATSKHYQQVKSFEVNSWKEGLYDFNFGSKIEVLLKQAGFQILHNENNMTDAELNFDGAAESKVLINWLARLARMQGLKNKFSDDYPEICDEIINSLKSNTHSKNNNVHFVVARKC
jgi:trans-aconitate methyltransferase